MINRSLAIRSSIALLCFALSSTGELAFAAAPLAAPLTATQAGETQDIAPATPAPDIAPKTAMPPPEVPAEEVPVKPELPNAPSFTLAMQQPPALAANSSSNTSNTNDQSSDQAEPGRSASQEPAQDQDTNNSSAQTPQIRTVDPQPAPGTEAETPAQDQTPQPDAQAAPGTNPSAAPAAATSSSTSTGASATRAQNPLGTAAAQKATTRGGAASKPAGVAIAPRKQKQYRSFLIKLGAIAAGGAALGAVYALSRGTSSTPPGAIKP